MSSGRGPARRAAALALAGFLATLLHGALAWRLLPPVNNDEYLPLFPLTWFSKLPEARTEHLEGYTASLFGVAVPVQAYFYVGSLKALVYFATGLSPEVATYRAFNLALVALVVAVAVFAATILAGGSRLAGLACLAFLASDTPLVVLGTTDEGPIDLGLLLALLLLLSVHDLALRPSPGKAALAALLLFLGVWDKLSFLWFTGAAAAGLAAAALARPWREASKALALLALAGGIAAVAVNATLPAHRDKVVRGLGRRLAPEQLLGHAAALLGRVEPLEAYHRYADVASGPRRTAYRVYGAGVGAVCLGAAVGCLALGLRRRLAAAAEAATPLFVGAFLAGLLAAMVETADATASHHAVLILPFAAVALAWLAAQARGAERSVRLALALGAGFSLYAGMRGLEDLRATPPLPGPNQVTRNAEDAWQAAARSELPEVYVLNWGAFYPGVVLSPPWQYWDLARDAGDACNRLRARGRTRAALLFRHRPRLDRLLRPGPDAAYDVVETRRFDRHPGDGWMLLSLRLR